MSASILVSVAKLCDVLWDAQCAVGQRVGDVLWATRGGRRAVGDVQWAKRGHPYLVSVIFAARVSIISY